MSRSNYCDKCGGAWWEHDDVLCPAREEAHSIERSVLRPNRRPAGDDDYVTKHHVVTTLRARVRGLARYYRRAQKEQGTVVTTASRWARKETRAAVGALRLVKPKTQNDEAQRRGEVRE